MLVLVVLVELDKREEVVWPEVLRNMSSLVQQVQCRDLQG